MSKPLAAPELPEDSLALRQELERLRSENSALRSQRTLLFDYIREKTNHLLRVIGTSPLRAEELDEEGLLEVDPIGIVTDSFEQVLEHLRDTNRRLNHVRESLEAIFNSAGVGILVLDPHMRVVAINHKMCDWFQVDERVLGQSCSSIVCKLDQPHCSCVFHQVLSSGRGEGCSDWQIGRRHFQVMGTPIKDGQGNISRIILVYADISDRMAAEEALRHALGEVHIRQERIDAILRSLADAVIVTNLEGRIALMNPVAEELFGVCLLGEDSAQLAGVIQNKGLRAKLKVALHRPQVADFSFPGKEQEGRRIFQGRSSAIYDKDHQLQGHVLVLRDLTREREVERLKREFVSHAGHELQTPLTAIVGFSELLLSDYDLDDKTRWECLSFINQKGEDLSVIVDNLLDINRIDSGRALELRSKPCDLKKLIEDVVESFRGKCRLHEFVICFPAEELILLFDPPKITRVLESLLSNAVKYSPHGGVIRTDLKIFASGLQVTISDPGSGIGLEHQARVFEPFYRIDASDSSISGAGLGLTVVKHMVEAHGGEVWIDSRPGLGTRVHFTLPLRLAISAQTP
jgi:PAS domain S-box-containing protein